MTLQHEPPEIRRDGLPHSTRALLDTFASANIDMIEVEFDGSGDDGVIGDIRCLRVNDPAMLSKNYFDVVRHEYNEVTFDPALNSKYLARIVAEDQTAESLVVSFAFDLLVDVLPGWRSKVAVMALSVATHRCHSKASDLHRPA